MAIQALPDTAAAIAWLRGRLGGQTKGELRTDSRQVQPGDAFIAWPGYAADGRGFVAAALASGASACLVEADGVEAFNFQGAAIAALPQLKAATGPIAAALLGFPAEAMAVIAVTGTNGKSSTAWWTAQALGALGQRCGVVGTLGMGEPPEHVVPTGLTTPDPVTLQRGLAQMRHEGFAACAIEASSIGLVEQRLAGLPIAVAQFTNFTQDHLDFHTDMAGYWAAKRRLFDWPGLRAAVVNVDDAQGEVLASELVGGRLDLWTVARDRPARLRGLNLRYSDGGMAFDIVEAGSARPDAHASVRCALIGDYNASNLLGVVGALRALGVPLADAAAAMSKLTPVPGRMQRVPARDSDGPEVVVDYAHTPDALDKALQALRPFAVARGGRLVCVFGCGGNRDAAKRPLMGALAHRLADQVVLTSDNPRNESPALILAQILVGIPTADAVDVIEDRHAAILHAVTSARSADVVLIAGKGHEPDQEIAGVKRPFSDVAVAAEALDARVAA